MKLTKNQLNKLIKEEIEKENYNNNILNESLFDKIGEKLSDFFYGVRASIKRDIKVQVDNLVIEMFTAAVSGQPFTVENSTFITSLEKLIKNLGKDPEVTSRLGLLTDIKKKFNILKDNEFFKKLLLDLAEQVYNFTVDMKVNNLRINPAYLRKINSIKEILVNTIASEMEIFWTR